MANKTVMRLAILLGVFALVGGGGYVLWAYQVERLANGIIARADAAEKAGKYADAEQLYREHLAVVPDDIEVKLKYAEAILKNQGSSRRQAEALMIFESVLGRHTGRDDVRRRAAELATEMGAFERARNHLDILLPSGRLKTASSTGKQDGHLEYLMGRCREHEGDFAGAAEYYGSAVEHRAPERIEAGRLRATLLRDKLGKKAEADKVIDAMVKSDPDDYRVYLARGRYRQLRDVKAGGDDFRKALQLAPPDRPEVYLEVARSVEREAGIADREAGIRAAREILDKGLLAAPKSVELYVALANLEQIAGRGDRAIEALELGLKAMPEELNLRLQLALLLASRGEAESGRLGMQIAELTRVGASRVLIQYFNAYQHINKREFIEARRILTSLQPDVGRMPDMRARVNQLLDRCYAGIGVDEPRQDAAQMAYSTNPKDPATRRGWIEALRGRGDLDGAIRECRALHKDVAGVGLILADLLIDRNRRLPEAQRDWTEPEQLIAQAAAAAPEAIGPALLRARLLLEQAGGREPALKVAYDKIETTLAQFPKDPMAWTTRAEMLIRQGRSDERKYDEARALLDRARRELGDRIELRLSRMLLISSRGGQQAVPALNELGRGLEAFSRDERRRLLTVLAAELGRQQDREGAAGAWARLVTEDPQNLLPHLQLFDLALQAGDAKKAEEQIEKVKGLSEDYVYLCRAQLLAWQARNADLPKEEARGKARGLLTELRTRRPDWSKVPMVMAALDEEELAEAGTDEALKRDKLESAITSYRRAIELGQRDPALARHYIQLLFRAGRGGEALEFYSQMPAVGQLTGDLWRGATEIAIANRDYHQAEVIAKKAVDSNPDDFQARVWLCQILLRQGRNDEAEAVLRKAIDDAKADPDRRIMLVRFMVLTRQADKAEEAVRDAKASIPAAPLAVAQCCAMVGKAFELGQPEKAKSWYGEARGWFAKAQQALKDPGDLSVKRRLAQFLLETNEAADAEAPLKDIMARTADGKSPTLANWARRSLARLYATSNPPRNAEALALFAGKSGDPDDAEDLRVLSQLHEAQGTPEGRRRAIAGLETLIGRGAATTEDRRRLAQLLEAVGEWPRAREQYRELILRADAARDADTIARRPQYLALLAEGLLRHRKPGDDADLAEARQLVERLKPIERGPLGSLILEAQIDLAAGHPEAASKRFRDFAARAGVTTAGRWRLADTAEALGLIDAAEQIHRRAADEPPPDSQGPPNKVRLAGFLARHGKLKEAVDICEGLWADPARRENLSAVCLSMLCDPMTPVDAAQTGRVIGWFQKASAEDPRAMSYHVGLGSLFERLGDYTRAEDAYRTAIKINDRDGVASNNLAWLIALRGDGETNEALRLINDAIRARPAVAEYLDTRGMILLRMGDVTQAIPDLEKAFKASPTAPKYFHLAQAYLQNNEKDKARKVLEVGKTRGLPGGLHRLEAAKYQELVGALGMK